MARRAWTCPDCHITTDGDHTFTDCVETLVKQRGKLEANLAEVEKANAELSERLKAAIKEIVTLCPFCQAAKRHSYSDATSPGFFFTECLDHRKALATIQGES